MICQLNISDKFKSTNFDKRKKYFFYNFHYTETKTLKKLSLLTDPNRKVSCHYFRCRWKNF